MSGLVDLFVQAGGVFVTQPETLRRKLNLIKAYVFDWDGVFTSGQKSEHGNSSFSEIDSMGTNLLRFGHWLRKGGQPTIGIITGERNATAARFSEREHFHFVYSQSKMKKVALEHLKSTYGLANEEVAYFFDDVPDIPIASVCGVRVLIRRNAAVLSQRYFLQHQLADYVTGQDSSAHAVREACELFLGLTESDDRVIRERSEFSPEYARYFSERQQIPTRFFHQNNAEIVLVTSDYFK